METTSEPTDGASRPRPPQHGCSEPRRSSSEFANSDKPIDQLQLVSIQPVEKVNNPQGLPYALALGNTYQ